MKNKEEKKDVYRELYEDISDYVETCNKFSYIEYIHFMKSIRKKYDVKIKESFNKP